MKCPHCAKIISGNEEMPDSRTLTEQTELPFDPTHETQALGYRHAVFNEVKRAPGEYAKCPYAVGSNEFYLYNRGLWARWGNKS